jgi:hypothetical protein
MSGRSRRRQGAAILAALVGLTSPLAAATLQVGPDAPLKTPSAAAAVAQDGDMIEIAAGDYFDCAIWRANDLTIAGAPAGTDGKTATLTDKSCEGKAAFITRGARIVLRNLTFTRIRVDDRNGAGIRVEGGDLTIEHSRFINDQIGILAADNLARTLIIRDCDFTANGLPDADRATADILAGSSARLLVTQSRFDAKKGGAAISSQASATELVGNRFTSATPMTYLIGDMTGGTLTMTANIITLAPGGAPRLGVVTTAADGDLPAGDIVLEGNSLTNDSGKPTTLLLNWRGITPRLARNIVARADTEVSDSGAIQHRLSTAVHSTIDTLRYAAGMARHLVGIVRQQL